MICIGGSFPGLSCVCARNSIVNFLPSLLSRSLNYLDCFWFLRTFLLIVDGFLAFADPLHLPLPFNTTGGDGRVGRRLRTRWAGERRRQKPNGRRLAGVRITPKNKTKSQSKTCH